MSPIPPWTARHLVEQRHAELLRTAALRGPRLPRRQRSRRSLIWRVRQWLDRGRVTMPVPRHAPSITAR